MSELKNKVKEFRNTVINKQDKLTPGKNISIDDFSVDESGKLSLKKSIGSDAIEALAECGVITPAYQDGTFYTDADNAIYVL